MKGKKIPMEYSEGNPAEDSCKNLVSKGNGAIRFSGTPRRLNVANRIATSSLNLALERGAGNVTVEDVAAAAGISRRTFYRYYATIDHALCVLPRRSIEHLTAELSARASFENIFKALSEVSRSTFPPEESELRELTNLVAQRFPIEWARALASAEVDAVAGMEHAVAARMALVGEDIRRAPLVTAVYLGVTQVLGRKHGAFGISPNLLDDTVRDLAEYMYLSFNSEVGDPQSRTSLAGHPSPKADAGQSTVEHSYRGKCDH